MSLKVLRLESHSQTGRQNGIHTRVRRYVMVHWLQVRATNILQIDVFA